MDFTPGSPPEPTDNRERGQALARIALPIALVLLGGYILQGFIRSLLWAAILAIAIGPLYERVRLRLGRARHDIWLPLLFAAAATLVVLAPLGLVAVEIGREAGDAARWLQSTRQNGLPPPELLERLPWFHDQVVAWWQDNLADPDSMRALLGRIDELNPMHVGRMFGAALLRSAVEFAFTVVALFFLFREGSSLGERALYACCRLFGPQGQPLARQIVASIHGTVDGLVLVGLGTGAIIGVADAIAGAPHPAMLGFATAIAAMIPMGATIMLVIAAALVLAGGKTVAAAVLLGVGMAVIFIADHAIRPALIGGATRLPFLWVLLGILGGVETFGLLGLFLGPAVMAALILLWREWTKDATTVTVE
jgi:predicted PurR-regulated permease PerM